MAYGSGVHGSGVLRSLWLCVAVVRRIVYDQNARTVSTVRICDCWTYRLRCVESAGVLRHHQFRACMVGESVLTNGQIGAIALNGAALGFVAFLFAKLLDVKLGNRKTTAIIMLVVEVTAASLV